MGRWDIQPSGVQSVLQRTEGVAAEFEGQMTSRGGGLEGAAAESSSGIVGEALAGYAESSRANITFVFTRTGACLSGAAGATNAYLDGDTAMAANAQASATAAPDPLATMPGRGNGPR